MSLTVSSCVVNTVHTTNDNSLRSRTPRDDLKQNGEIIPDKWKYLIKKSDAIVVGKVEEIRWVAKPEDIKSVLSYTGNDLSEIAPKKFVKGVLVRLLVTEVLDKHDNVEVGKIVDIYV
jgi:hypothetical protein